MKRLFDIVFSGTVLLLTAPVMIGTCVLVWLYDRHSPFYRAKRVGLNSSDFEMLKIRSMRVDADKSGVSSTSTSDNRITPIGHYIRKFKLDELSQFWNVFKGDMSVVGPRPNIRRGGVDLYTPAELGLLDTKPGITDISSIVFSDEGDILNGADDPDALYNQIIRPWKSQLGLLYIGHQSLRLDIRIIYLTVVAITSKPKALEAVHRLLRGLNADQKLIDVCRRDKPLVPSLPVKSSAS